ncbi:MAG: hypothetical protein MPW14_19145 [Candidatus Manganitrophus sp.]|nr:hypothetical protein [Candidatus Manganitrophus sp.]MDC4225419.1 hypothetical protein [Candidatus Manganitrophus sp.]WDT73209.1 MAG: hypothetical protein MPW17_10300 [Candidatus Manganitrophus sp.]WDT79242.1 MAG: hypothetical protein MPW14_19145 [Candidatus Manganitrophus sp.]
MKLEIPIRKQISLFSMMVALVLFFTGCQGGEENGTASVRLSFNLSSSKTGAAKTASAPAPSGITSVRIDVTGPGMELLSDSVAVNSEEETVVDLEIPAGPARRFVVTAFDIENAPHFRGEETVDLVPGSSANIRISMLEIDVTVPPAIQISPKISVLTRSTPNNPVTQTFTLTNAKTSEINLFVNGQLDGTAELGQTGPGETENTARYTAPDIIPIDRTNTPIGVPTPITVEAVDKANPNRRDEASVRLVTGPQLTFGQNVPVTPATTTFRPISTDSSGQRSIAYHEGKVYAVWSQFYNPRENMYVFFSQSENGTDWSSPISVTGAINQDFTNKETEPMIVVGQDGTVYVALTTNDCPFCSVPSLRVQLLALSVGATEFRSLFGPYATNNSNTPFPSVAVSSNGILFLAWSGQELRGNIDIFLQRLNGDGSLIDNAPRNLTKDFGVFTNTKPVLSIGEDGRIYLIWEQSPNTRNFLAIASSDGGNTFTAPALVNDISDFGINNPSVSAGPAGTVYVAWDNSNCDCDPEVFFDVGKIEDNTLVFGEDNPIGHAISNSESQRTPSIAWDQADGIYIGFEETLDGFDENGIFLAKSRNEGSVFTFSRIDDGSDDVPNKLDPSIAVDRAGRVFSIWTRLNFSSQGVDDVYFAKGE